MAVIGNLAVKLSAQTSGLEKGMRGATASVQKFAGIAKKAALIVGGIGIAAGAAAMGGIALMMKQQFGAVDSLAKMSDRLGMTTEGLAGMELAAKLAGVQTNQMTMAMQRMTRRIAEAGQGSGEAVAALNELGLDAARLSRLSPEDQFREITKSMQGVSRQSDRIRLAFKLFDSEGVSMLQIIQDGTDGLDHAMRKAQEFGTAISRYDANKVEQMNDAVTLLSESTTGFARRLAVQVAPGLQLAVELFADFLNSGTGAAAGVTRALGGLGDMLVTLSTLLDQMNNKVTKVGSGIMLNVGSVLQMVGNIIGNESLQGAGLGLSQAGDVMLGTELSVSERTRRMAERLAEIQINAHKKAKQMAGRVLGKGFDLPGITGGDLDSSGSTPRPPTLEQVRFDRILPGALTSKPQPVRVDGLNDVHQTLKQMERNQRRPVPGVVTA